MRVVVALGENALLNRGQTGRRHDVATAAGSLATLADRNELVIVHGNGPYVGSLAERHVADPHPGYRMFQALQHALPGRQVVAVVNQTLVSAADPAFEAPRAFVGPAYSQDEARRLAEENGWTVRGHGDHWRRVVPSPQPRRVIETGLIGMLLRDGAVVFCAGGGGIPVVHDHAGGLLGVEAIIDRDRTGAMLAGAIAADAFLILAGVPRCTQVEAARGFAERTGAVAAIGRLDQCVRLLEGTTPIPELAS